MLLIHKSEVSGLSDSAIGSAHNHASVFFLLVVGL